MRKLCSKMWNDERGNALILAGAALPLLVGSAGLATDTIHWTLWKRELQRAADSAAIAGVYERLATNATTGVADVVDHDLELNHHTGKIGGVALAFEATYPKVSFPADNAAEDIVDQVKVELAVRKVLPFSSLFMDEAPLIRAEATAASVPGSDMFCVVSLETNPNNSGIIISGNAGIEMDCSFMSNSPSPNSAYAKGSALVYADSVAAVGGIQESSNWHVDSYDPYSPAVADPFANVTPAPSDMKCAGKWVTKGKTTTWQNDVLTENTDVDAAVDSNGNKANCWASMSVGSNTELSLPSGTYYINGGDMDIQGNLNCTGCTFVLTNKSTASNATIGELKVNASSEINISAPTGDGDYYKGIAIYQDRRAQDGASKVNKINGNSSSTITGALYFPNQELQYNGTGNTTASCTLFVSRRINFTGNSATLNKFKIKDCAGAGLPAVEGGRLVRLVG